MKIYDIKFIKKINHSFLLSIVNKMLNLDIKQTQ